MTGGLQAATSGACVLISKIGFQSDVECISCFSLSEWRFQRFCDIPSGDNAAAFYEEIDVVCRSCRPLSSSAFNTADQV